MMTALGVVACVGIVGVYLVLSVVLRDARMRRARAGGGAIARPRLSASLVAGRSRIVVAAESRCPLCRVVLARLGERVDEFPTAPVLLTTERVVDWHGVPSGITVVQDAESWERIVHLIPPVLMQVAADGQVTDLVLPFDETDVDAAVARWAGA